MKIIRNSILPALILCLTFITVELNAQTFGSNVIGVENENKTEEKTVFNPEIHLNVGTSFTSGFGDGFNAFNTWIAPEITNPVSKKIDISFGMAYSMMNFNGLSNSGFNNSANYGSLYVSGTYQVNPKLKVRATAYKTFLLNPDNFTENNNPYLDFSNQGAIFDMEYKFGEHFSVSASFHYRQQNNPYLYMNQGGNFNNNQGFGAGFGGFNPGF